MRSQAKWGEGIWHFSTSHGWRHWARAGGGFKTRMTRINTNENPKLRPSRVVEGNCVTETRSVRQLVGLPFFSNATADLEPPRRDEQPAPSSRRQAGHPLTTVTNRLNPAFQVGAMFLSL